MKKETTKRQSEICSFGIESFIILCIAVPIILGLNSFYYNFQKSIFSNADTILFIHDKLSGFIIFFSPLIILFCIASNIKSNTSIRIMKVKIFSFIAIVIFAISILILILQFFECVAINKERIYVRSGIFSTNKNYMWSDVTDVEVSYEIGPKHKIDISYNMHLDDGTIVDASDSQDFFSNIINLDDFIKDKRIKIIRSNIKSSDYSEFTGVFDDDRMKVILKILNK